MFKANKIKESFNHKNLASCFVYFHHHGSLKGKMRLTNKIIKIVRKKATV